MTRIKQTTPKASQRTLKYKNRTTHGPAHNLLPSPSRAKQTLEHGGGDGGLKRSHTRCSASSGRVASSSDPNKALPFLMGTRTVFKTGLDLNDRKARLRKSHDNNSGREKKSLRSPREKSSKKSLNCQIFTRSLRVKAKAVRTRRQHHRWRNWLDRRAVHLSCTEKLRYRPPPSSRATLRSANDINSCMKCMYKEKLNSSTNERSKLDQTCRSN